MRLIDADALIKEYCKWFHQNPEEADSTDDDIYDFIKKVEEQPIVYDIDKEKMKCSNQSQEY